MPFPSDTKKRPTLKSKILLNTRISFAMALAGSTIAVEIVASETSEPYIQPALPLLKYLRDRGDMENGFWQ